MNFEFHIFHLTMGACGGLVRGLVGVMKQASGPDDFKFKWGYFLLSILVSGIVGVVSGVIADGDFRIALLAGYSGTDFLESLYRVKFNAMANGGTQTTTTK